MSMTHKVRVTNRFRVDTKTMTIRQQESEFTLGFPESIKREKILNSNGASNSYKWNRGYIRFHENPHPWRKIFYIIDDPNGIWDILIGAFLTLRSGFCLEGSSSFQALALLRYSISIQWSPWTHLVMQVVWDISMPSYRPFYSWQIVI